MCVCTRSSMTLNFRIQLRFPVLSTIISEKIFHDFIITHFVFWNPRFLPMITLGLKWTFKAPILKSPFSTLRISLVVPLEMTLKKPFAYRTQLSNDLALNIQQQQQTNCVHYVNYLWKKNVLARFLIFCSEYYGYYPMQMVQQREEEKYTVCSPVKAKLFFTLMNLWLFWPNHSTGHWILHFDTKF